MDVNEEVFCENSIFFIYFFFGGGGGGRGRVGGGQGGCERRIEVLGKIHKKKIGGGGGVGLWGSGWM